MMMAVVFAAFLICWIPWWIMYMIMPYQPAARAWIIGKKEDGVWTPYNFLTWMGKTAADPRLLTLCPFISAYSNSCINPITMGKDIREGIVLLFHKLTWIISKKFLSDTVRMS